MSGPDEIDPVFEAAHQAAAGYAKIRRRELDLALQSFAADGWWLTTGPEQRARMDSVDAMARADERRKIAGELDERAVRERGTTFDPPLTDDERDGLTAALAELHGDRPHLRAEPGMRGGAPHVRGISAESIASMAAAGETPETVLAEFGFTRPDALVACWFMAVYGTRLAEDPVWDGWGPWLDEHSRAMARGDWGQVPDPPAFLPERGPMADEEHMPKGRRP